MQLYEAGSQQRLTIDHASATGEARRAAQALATATGLDEVTVGKVAIVATELATNLWRHAGGGELLIQTLGKQVEILTIDRGAGMANIERCLSDGYSTAGSAGQGLGAVQRASSEFDLHSSPGKGSVVMARVGPVAPVRFGAICVPLRGEHFCGDSWTLAAGAEGTAACVVDGLGHGSYASQAARAMTESFAKAPFDEPKTQIEQAHVRMSGTRGAAGACSKLRASGALSYAGVGNVSGHLLSPANSQGLVSHSGILGVQARRVQQFEYPVAPDSLLVMHSDGVSARWTLDVHPGLRSRHPSVIAGVLFREHARPRDDATVLVVEQ